MPIRCACEQRRLASVEIDPRPMHGGQQFIANPVERAKNRSKSKVRAKVEHSIGVIKHVFGFAKVRYRGLKKNERHLIVTCALANLFIVPDSTPATIAIRRVVICLICGKHHEAGAQTQSNGRILSLWTRFVGHPAPVPRLSATRSALIQTFPNCPAGYTPAGGRRPPAIPAYPRVAAMPPAVSGQPIATTAPIRSTLSWHQPLEMRPREMCQCRT